MGELHLIFTEDQVLVSKKAYVSWREIQSEYDNYKASLGPWTEEATVSWLCEEYADLAPSSQQQVAMLLSSNEEVHTITFREEEFLDVGRSASGRVGMTTRQPLRRNVLRWAAMAAAVDMVLYVVTIIMQYYSSSQFLSARRAWLSLHEPALVIATELLPGLPSAHGPLPLVSAAGLMILALVQMGIVGGVLGLVYTLIRRV